MPIKHTALLNNNYQIKLDPLAYKGLCLLLLEAGIDGNDVCNDFINYYVNYASKYSDKLVEICSQTGFSKHMVKKFLSTNNENIKPKAKSPYKSLISELELLSKRHKDELIPIYGKHQSFKSTYDTYGPSNHESTAVSTFDHLVKVGILEKHDRRFKFVSSLPKIGCAKLDTNLKELALMIYRLSHTIKHNIACEHNDDTLYQMQYFSTSIEAHKHKNVADELRLVMREAFSKCKDIIDQNEEPSGFSRKRTESKSIEIGVSAFIFNNTKE